MGIEFTPIDIQKNTLNLVSTSSVMLFLVASVSNET